MPNKLLIYKKKLSNSNLNLSKSPNFFVVKNLNHINELELLNWQFVEQILQILENCNYSKFLNDSQQLTDKCCYFFLNVKLFNNNSFTLNIFFKGL